MSTDALFEATKLLAGMTASLERMKSERAITSEQIRDQLSSLDTAMSEFQADLDAERAKLKAMIDRIDSVT